MKYKEESDMAKGGFPGGMGGMKAVSSDQTESKETAITVSGDSYPLTVTDYFDHET